MAETQVKNTFIDVPSTGTPVPSPPASAPARQQVALKDSLQKAAEEPGGSPTAQAAPQAAPAAPAAASTAGSVVRRAKPNPLNFLSQNSMVSIPEDQANGQAKPADPMKFVSGVSELPSTPAYTWGVLQTPTGTPSGYRAYQAPMIPAVATPTDVQRKTLSLQEMIQSPKVEDKAALLNNSYHQLWNVQQYPPQAPMVPQGALHAVPHGAPMAMAMHMAPDASYSVPQAGVPGCEMYMPNMLQAPHPPIFSSVPVQHMPPPAPMLLEPPPGGAAVTLGLVHGGQPMPPMPQPLPQMSPPLQQPMPQPMPQPLPQPMPQPMPQAVPVTAQPPLQPMQPLPMQPAAQPLQAQFGLPSYAAPHAAPGVLMTHPGLPGHPGLPPPPPTFAAPAVVMSPKASAQPAMTESDIRSLLETATASGNPEAINAVARQAQMAGMSPEKFRSLLPPPTSA